MLDAGEPPLFEAKLTKYKGEDIEVRNQEAADSDCRRGEQGQVAGRQRRAEEKSAAIRRRRSPLPSCSRPPTTACATPPSAP